MLNLGNDRECFFDDHLLDTEMTTADFRLHEPVRRETVLTHGEPWEGDGSDYHNFFFDDAFPGVDGSHPAGVYRMYYLGWNTPNGAPDCKPWHDIVVCYAESPDGIRWEKPSLGLSEFDGSKENNIILGKEFGCNFDNFMVFRDDNPACPADEKYKGIASYQSKTDPKPSVLYSYFSSDGIRFRRGRMVTDKGKFDSLNVIFWDSRAGLYRGYIRGFHDIPENGDLNAGIRDIRYIESADFVNWTEPVMIDFGDREDYPLYTNVVSPYFRAPQMYLGFPTRYMERKGWTETFDELCGAEKRRERMKIHPRYGLTVTDCVFMCSRDGKAFFRHEDAFLRPGPENGRNWLYGDGYPARGFAVTPSDCAGEPDELSLYLPRYHWMNCPKELVRYTLRLDGFASLHAGYAKEEVVVTKPFTYDGEELYINFSTSARGYLYFTLRCGEQVYESCETFGDAVDRRIAFPAGAVSACAGKEVTLEVRMRDADLYAIRFGEKAE